MPREKHKNGTANDRLEWPQEFDLVADDLGWNELATGGLASKAGRASRTTPASVRWTYRTYFPSGVTRQAGRYFHGDNEWTTRKPDGTTTHEVYPSSDE